MNEEIKFFEDYVSNFDKNDEKIDHKYKHSYRVVGYAKEIADSLNLDEKEKTRASICALFHDIGRFVQVEKYDTYNDKKSFDHGDRGAEILKDNGYTDSILLNAVKYHNKKVIPVFDELTDMHCKIVRDADKIDIMTIWGNTENDENYIVSDDIMNCFKKHIQMDNDMGKSEFVYSLRCLAFIFDINYKKSIEIIIEKGLISFKLNILRKKSLNKEQIDIIEKELKEYIKERFDIIC